jgi:hypothetical protein
MARQNLQENTAVTRIQYLSLCSLVLIGAFAGGYAANRAIPVAHAQVLGPQDIRATGFTLVNAQGKVEASLRSGAMGAELILNDANGKPRAEAGPGGFVVRDATGRILWASPHGIGIVPASAGE